MSTSETLPGVMTSWPGTSIGSAASPIGSSNGSGLSGSGSSSCLASSILNLAVLLARSSSPATCPGRSGVSGCILRSAAGARTSSAFSFCSSGTCAFLRSAASTLSLPAVVFLSSALMRFLQASVCAYPHALAFPWVWMKSHRGHPGSVKPKFCRSSNVTRRSGKEVLLVLGGSSPAGMRSPKSWCGSLLPVGAAAALYSTSCGLWLTCSRTWAGHLSDSGLRCRLLALTTVCSAIDHRMYSLESREKPRNTPSCHLLPSFPSRDLSFVFFGSL